MSCDSAEFLLREYVARHNLAVRTGEFSPLLDLFAEQAQLQFSGVPFGPFVGRGAIGQAFCNHRPDDELTTTGIAGSPSSVRARFAWARRPGRLSGEIALESDNGRIVLLQIAVD